MPRAILTQMPRRATRPALPPLPVVFHVPGGRLGPAEEDEDAAPFDATPVGAW